MIMVKHEREVSKKDQQEYTNLKLAGVRPYDASVKTEHSQPENEFEPSPSPSNSGDDSVWK